MNMNIDVNVDVNDMFPQYIEPCVAIDCFLLNGFDNIFNFVIIIAMCLAIHYTITNHKL